MDEAKALLLLKEWFEWWESDPRAPAKLPKALHIKTALLLKERELLGE